MPKAKPAETPAVEILEPEIPVNKSSRNKKAIEKHTVTTEWKEVKRIDAPPAKARKPAPIVEVEDDDDVEDDDLDELDEVLSEYGNGPTGLMMEISRLPNYDVDGRTDPMARSYITERPFDRTTFLQDLSVFCARPTETNVFLIRLKRDKKLIERGTLGPFRVEPASAEDKAKYGIKVAPEPVPAAVTVTQAIPMQIPAQPPQSVTERISEVAQIFSVFKEMGLIPKQQNPAPVQTVEPELTEEAILLRAAMASPEAKEKVANGIGKLVFGGAIEAAKDEAPYWFEPAVSIVSNLLQSIAPGINSLLQVTAQAKQIEIQRVQQPVISSPEGMAAIPPPESVQQAPMEPLPIQASAEIPPEDELFGRILGACARRQLLKPEVAARNLLDYTDQFTQPETGYNKFNEAYDIFITNDVKTIITLAAAQNPIAARMAGEPDTEGWLTALQDELRKELSGDDGNQGQ